MTQCFAVKMADSISSVSSHCSELHFHCLKRVLKREMQIKKVCTAIFLTLAFWIDCKTKRRG